MRKVALLLFLILAPNLMGCSGPVLQTLSPTDRLPEPFDGALLNYYLARGELVVTATYTLKSDLLVVSMNPQVSAAPDFRHKLTLAYTHGELSTDEISVQFDGGLLKKVSSTTADQTIQAVQAINAILTQVGSVQTAIAKSTTPKARAVAAAKCSEDIKVQLVADITYHEDGQKDATVLSSDPLCKIKLSVKVYPSGTLAFAAYPKHVSDVPRLQSCDQAVCFRLTGSYRVEATARLVHNTAGALSDPVVATVDLIAPHRNRLGFVRFNRRRFVANSTSISFTNGMVSEFTAKDPSELVGFLSLPSEILKGVSLTIPLVK